MLKLGNPFAPYNPFALVDWLLAPVDWFTGQLGTWSISGLGWLLSSMPPGLCYLSYIVLAIWLTGWTHRHFRMIPLNPESPMFQQPYGAKIWMHLSWFRLLLVLGAAGIGFIMPDQLAHFFWNNSLNPDADTLGPMGRIAELVGLVCGFRIGWHCQYQLNLLMLIGLLGWLFLSLAQFVFGS